jgi:NitT/TauT family transport system substrate-binding protein
VLADMRTAAGVKEAFGTDTYPGSVLYSSGDWIRANRDTGRAPRTRDRADARLDADAQPAGNSREDAKAFRGDDDAMYVEALKASMRCSRRTV